MIGFNEEGDNNKTFINRDTGDAAESEICYCTITRKVTGTAKTLPNGSTKTFLSIIIMVRCEKEKHYDEGPTISGSAGFKIFHSFKKTPCEECPCGGGGGPCVASMTKSEVSDNPPKWAKEMQAGAPAEQVAETINTEVQEPGDPMGYGPYNSQGHPKCSSPVVKKCCPPATASADSFGTSI
jgi:hypothetical protein